MFVFYDITEEEILEPILEFKTTLKINPTKILEETENTFAIASNEFYSDIYIKKKTMIQTYRITPEFKLKINPQNPNQYNQFQFFSAKSPNYLTHLTTLLDLQPCFKIKPEGIDPPTIKKLILNSSCKYGYLEILTQNTYHELIITPEVPIAELEFEFENQPNRIHIYDIEKNQCEIQPLTETYTLPKSSTPLHTKLLNLILDYTEKNISKKLARDIPINRDAIYRSETNPETFNITLTTIKNILKQIKTDREKHTENIKNLISVFYAENFLELENQGLTSTLEKFYTEI